MLDDLVCPNCDVLLRTGSNVCVKCGRTVKPGKTGIPFIDWPTMVYEPLARHLGPIMAGIITGLLCLLLLALFFGMMIWKLKQQQ